MHARTTAALVAIMIIITGGTTAMVLTGSDNSAERVDYKSDEFVTDYEGREVPIPTSLDGGIVTVGRLSTLRWLAYFPDEFENVIMVDHAMKEKNAGALAYSHAYGDILSKASVHSNDSIDEGEKIVQRNPSLILVNHTTYESSKEACEKLAKMSPLAVIDTMGDLETKGFWNEDYTICDRFIAQADLYGKLLRNVERGEEIKELFQDAVDDIRSYCDGDSMHTTYIGGVTNQGGNPLTSTYNPYLPHALVGGNNAIGDGTSDKRIDLSPEDLENLSFDHMIIDPATVQPNKEGINLLNNTPSQGVLLNVYERDDDVKLFIALPMISHSANWLCVLSSAYHMASIEYGILTIEEVKEKSENLFKEFYGEERGSGVLESMERYFTDVGEEIHEDLCTTPFAEVKITKVDNDKYIFTKV